MSPRSVRVDLGGWTVAVTTPDGGLAGALRHRWGAFVTDAVPDFSILHEPAAPLYEDDHVPCFALIEPAERRARIAGPGDPERVDGVLRTLLPEIVGDAALLHGALLADGGRGFACCGGSGAGKSTLAGLLPEHALCDEQVLLLREGGQLELRALPFWTARPGRVALAGIHLLEHAPAHRRDRLAPPTALRTLARHVRWPQDRVRAAAAFAILADAVLGAPVWRLGFAPRPDVWHLISGGKAA